MPLQESFADDSAGASVRPYPSWIVRTPSIGRSGRHDSGFYARDKPIGPPDRRGTVRPRLPYSRPVEPLACLARASSSSNRAPRMMLPNVTPNRRAMPNEAAQNTTSHPVRHRRVRWCYVAGAVLTFASRLCAG